MKTFFYLFFVVIVVTLSIILINLPLRTIQPLLTNYFPQITYSDVSGKIWSGKISNLTFANEKLGDLITEMDLRSLEFNLIDSQVEISGKLKLVDYLFTKKFEMYDLDFEIGSRRFIKNLPTLSKINGEKINLTFDLNGCYEASGKTSATILRKSPLNIQSDSSLVAELECRDAKLYGEFESYPDKNFLSGFFYIDNELNYNLSANSKNIFSRLSKIFKGNISENPDVKIKGNIYELFYE